jgi:hypothetical protein
MLHLTISSLHANVAYVSKFHQNGHDVSILNKNLENINIQIPSTLYLAWNLIIVLAIAI